MSVCGFKVLKHATGNQVPLLSQAFVAAVVLVYFSSNLPSFVEEWLVIVCRFDLKLQHRGWMRLVFLNNHLDPIYFTCTCNTYGQNWRNQSRNKKQQESLMSPSTDLMVFDMRAPFNLSADLALAGTCLRRVLCRQRQCLASSIRIWVPGCPGGLRVLHGAIR